MIKIEETETYGWKAAIRGMRNPKNSWDKSDSKQVSDMLMDEQTYIPEHFEIGPNDSNLMHRLCKAGSDHRKFMRMIIVYCDITAPLYWWKEFDTYKVGTVANSCSTMHKIHAKEFTIDDFSQEHLITREKPLIEGVDSVEPPNGIWLIHRTMQTLNQYRELYLQTKDKKYWWQMIQLLPSSYNQKRTVMLNYEVLTNIYNSRKHHKLDEWHDFCDWIKSLPHSELITHNQDKYDSFWEVLRSTYGTTLDDPIARAIIFGEPITEEMIYNYEHSKE